MNAFPNEEVAYIIRMDFGVRGKDTSCSAGQSRRTPAASHKPVPAPPVFALSPSELYLSSSIFYYWSAWSGLSFPLFLCTLLRFFSLWMNTHALFIIVLLLF